MRAGRVGTGAAAGALVLVLGGCGSGPAGGSVAETPGTCLTRPSAPPVAGPSVDGGFLADLGLPCFDGSGIVQLRQLGGPAVVNLWASWCLPCRQELPAFQRLARHSAGQITVVGVSTADTPEAARSVVDDLGLTFPMLVDERRQVLFAVGRSALPVTLFVAADGQVTHIYNGEALDDDALDRLITRHLRVAPR